MVIKFYLGTLGIPIWLWRIQKTGSPKWLALVSGNMGTKTCGWPLLFTFEPHPYNTSTVYVTNKPYIPVFFAGLKGNCKNSSHGHSRSFAMDFHPNVSSQDWSRNNQVQLTEGCDGSLHAEYLQLRPHCLTHPSTRLSISPVLSKQLCAIIKI